MRFARLSIPDELLEAQRNDELVWFVGAGASMGSGLPDFAKLTRDIAEAAQVPVSGEELRRPDEFLGRLAADYDVPVHQRVADIIGDPASEPNDLHRAVVGLAGVPDADAFRIVTTNYDGHLTLSASGVEPLEFVAPALPVGSDFGGLVYLHGKIGHADLRHLVVTDSDFGRAYLTDAWAARFLERVFNQYTVVFVGYSHDDMIMQYLARGLARKDARYALTDKHDPGKWRRLGIEPIVYPNDDGSHRELVVGLSRWAERATMGMLDHHQLLAQLLSAPPELTAEEGDYLRDTLRDPARVKLFTDLARDPAWLSWVSRQPEFQQLLAQDGKDDEVAQVLAWWFVQTFVCDPMHCEEALELVIAQGGVLSWRLWEVVSRLLVRRNAEPLVTTSRWVELLIQNDVSAFAHHHLLEMLLSELSWTTSWREILRLFEHLLRPRVANDGLFMRSSGRMTVSLAGDEYWLTEVWAKQIRPNLAEAAPALLQLAEHHIHTAAAIMSNLGWEDGDWEPLWSRRSAIEPHEQDTMRDSVDVVLDVGRDALEHVIAADPNAADQTIATWVGSGVTILQRLGLHGWIIRSDRSPDEKLQWLKSSGFLFKHRLRHEVFRLLGDTMPLAEAALADEIVDLLDRWPRESDDPELNDYLRFNALHWVAQQAPDLESAAWRLEAIKKARPNFAPRDYPDLLSSMSTGFETPDTAIQERELASQIDADVRQAVLDWAVKLTADPAPGEPHARRIMELVVQHTPSRGIALLDNSEGKPEVTEAVLDALTAAPLDHSSAESILRYLLAVRDIRWADRAATLLDRGRDADGNSYPWHEHERARELARWSLPLVSGAATDPGIGHLARSVNSSPGSLAEFWVRFVQHQRRQAGVSWSGFDRPLADDLAPLVDPGAANAALTVPVLAAALHVLHAADPAWTLDHVLPLMKWDGPLSAHAWDGFLTWGRWNSALLEAGLLDSYLDTLGQDLPEDSEERLLEHLASIAIHHTDGPQGWLGTLCARTTDASRALWADDVSSELGRLDEPARDGQWDSWMEWHWQQRLAGIPTQLGPLEASSLALWAFHVPGRVDRALPLAMARNVSYMEHRGALHRLSDGEPLTDAAMRVLAHVLAGSDLASYVGYHLEKIVRAASGSASFEARRLVVEEALRFGCSSAYEWLQD